MIRFENAAWTFALVALACQSTPQADPPDGVEDEVEPSGGDDGLPPEPAMPSDSSDSEDELRPAGETRPAGDSARGARGMGEACGGIAGFSCAEPLFCQFPVEAQCGAADQMGECQEVPEMCTREYRPVCGCDGTTYANTCGAHSAGVSVALKQPCAEDGSR